MVLGWAEVDKNRLSIHKKDSLTVLTFPKHTGTRHRWLSDRLLPAPGKPAGRKLTVLFPHLSLLFVLPFFGFRSQVPITNFTAIYVSRYISAILLTKDVSEWAQLLNRSPGRLRTDEELGTGTTQSLSKKRNVPETFFLLERRSLSNEFLKSQAQLTVSVVHIKKRAVWLVSQWTPPTITFFDQGPGFFVDYLRI